MCTKISGKKDLNTLAVFFIHSVWKGAAVFHSMHWVKSWEPQVARLSQWESTALYVGWEQKSERGSLLTLCVFIWARSHKPGINAQHGTAIPPAAQRPRSAVSQPLPFTVPCPLSASAQQWQKDSVSPPPATLPLSHALLKLLLAGAILWQLRPTG